jgi:hypothetical protein
MTQSSVLAAPQGMSYIAATVLMHGDAEGTCTEVYPVFNTVANLLEGTILLPLLRMEPATLDTFFDFWRGCFQSALPVRLSLSHSATQPLSHSATQPLSHLVG